MRRIQMAGHPLHPAFVHFPLGILPLVPLWDLLGIVRGEPYWWTIAFWTAVAGVAIAGITLTTGFLDYAALPEDERITRTADRHMYVMLAAGGIFIGRLLAQGGAAPPAGGSSILALALSVVGAVLLLLGGWLGGELVYEHGVGVKEGGGDR